MTYSKEKAIQSVNIALDILKTTLVESGYCIGVNKSNGDLIFFSKEDYLKNKTVGFKVSIEDFKW